MSGTNFEGLDLQVKPSKGNKADIVFCIDFSGSMTGVIEGVKKYIVDFVNRLNTDPENPLDVRIGFIGQYYGTFFIKGFTEDPNDFAQALSPLKTGGDEFTLPALDWALDFEWRDGVHKIVVLFTDECLDTGAYPEKQWSKREELIKKIDLLHIKVFAYGPPCEKYTSFFSETPRSSYHEVDFAYINVDDMKPVLLQIAKTISQNTKGNAQEPLRSGIKKDIYEVSSIPNFNIIYL